MGQIIIEIPNQMTRRFRLDSGIAELIDYLEDTAEPIVFNPAEDAEDMADAQKSLEEYLRSGKSFSWQRIKAELNL